MTLLELLVVVVIILLLLAVFAPLVRTSSRDRRVREASRALSGYINGTRLLASLRGRPVGIWIERFKTEQPNNGMYSTTVFTAEVPPPYAGFDVDTRAKLVYRPGPPAEWEIVFGNNLHLAAPIKDQLIYTNSPTAMIKPGESFRVRFDYRGPLYRAYRDQTNPSICVLDLNYPNAPPVPRFAQAQRGASFQVYRAPIKSAQPPLQLPVNSAIDLLASGFGAIGTEFGVGFDSPLVILFEPSGDLGRVYCDNQELPVNNSIHLLIGRPDQVIGPVGNVFVNDGLDLSNIMDMTSLWVTISHRTGQVTTTENASPWRPGPDGKWGVAGTDDNGNGMVDEVAEQGWVGSDDLLAVSIARQFARGKITGGGL
jgi:type II secretory pathway pseudopilin PulG